MQIHGILTLQDPDVYGEVLDVIGANTERIEQQPPLYWDGGQDANGKLVRGCLGQVLEVRKLITPDDCKSDVDRGLWDVCRGKPFIKVKALLSKPRTSPCAKAITQILEDSSRVLYFSAWGLLLERAGGRLMRTRLTEVFLTFNGVHKAQAVRLGLGE